MPETKHLVLLLNLVAPLIVGAWSLGGEEMNLAPQPIAKRATRVPKAATNQLRLSAEITLELYPHP